MDMVCTLIPTLEVALSQHMNVDQLKMLAALTGAPIPRRKAELVEVVMDHLEGGRLRAVWQSMNELQRAAVAEVVHSSGTFFARERFNAKYGSDPGWGWLDPYQSNRKPTPLRFFFYNGVMPDDLKARLAQFVPPPARVEVESLEAPPAEYQRTTTYWNHQLRKMESRIVPVPITVRESELAAQRELLGVLRLVDSGKVAVSDKTRKPSASTMTALAAVLEGGDFYSDLPPDGLDDDSRAGPIRAFAWPLLLQAGGLAHLAGKRLQLTPAGRKALAAPPAATLRHLWQKWTSTTLLDELSRLDCVKGQSGKGKRGLTGVTGRRRALCDVLAECPRQRWVEADEFLRFMLASGHSFDVCRTACQLYIGDPNYGALGYDGSASFLRDRYAFCLLFEYAATLGMVDVAFVEPARARGDYRELWGTDELSYLSRYDGLLYLRLTPLGTYVLGLASEYAPPTVEVKRVLRTRADFEIAVAGDATLEKEDRVMLDTFAVPVSDLAWQLQPEKFVAAIEGGRTVAEFEEYLAARVCGPLVGSVVGFLDGMVERCGHVRDQGSARLIECADPALAALISHDVRTRKHCLKAGTRHLVIPAPSEDAFRRALREIGYLVAPQGDGPAQVRKKGRGASAPSRSRKEG